MKGIKYNYSFIKPDKEEVTFNFLTMNQLIDSIKLNFKDSYFIDLKVNKTIIYNIIHRPLKASKILRDRLSIERIRN